MDRYLFLNPSNQMTSYYDVGFGRVLCTVIKVTVTFSIGQRYPLIREISFCSGFYGPRMANLGNNVINGYKTIMLKTSKVNTQLSIQPIVSICSLTFPQFKIISPFL